MGQVNHHLDDATQLIGQYYEENETNHAFMVLRIDAGPGDANQGVVLYFRNIDQIVAMGEKLTEMASRWRLAHGGTSSR